MIENIIVSIQHIADNLTLKKDYSSDTEVTVKAECSKEWNIIY